MTSRSLAEEDIYQGFQHGLLLDRPTGTPAAVVGRWELPQQQR